MTLAAQQDAILDICFAPTPSEGALDRVGDRERWLVYRKMVRARLHRVCTIALPRTVACAGEARFDAWVERWFAQRGPRTRYFWRVIGEFADFTLEQEEPGPAWLLELLRYEATLWHTRHDEAEPGSSALPLDFERVPSVNPTLSLLHFGHPVHRALREDEGAYPREPTQLAVFRRADDDKAVTWTLNPMGAALVGRWQLERETLREAVLAVTAERGTSMTPRFLESLAGLLEGLLERGLLLGSR